VRGDRAALAEGEHGIAYRRNQGEEQSLQCIHDALMVAAQTIGAAKMTLARKAINGRLALHRIS
jgi:hypothetical protein